MMHDLIQDMGREIVRQESPNDPGQRSRLWFHKDILHVLEENAGSNKVEGIKLTLSEPEEAKALPSIFLVQGFQRLEMYESFSLLHGAGIEELPSSIERITGKLGKFPIFSHKKRKFTSLNEGSSSTGSASSLNLFPSLGILNLRNCNLTEVNFLVDTEHFPALCELVLDDNNITAIPACLPKLAKLKVLHVSNCKLLREIPVLWASVWAIDADGCGSKWIMFADYHRLITTHVGQLISVLRPEGFVRGHKMILIPGSAIPEWFSHKSTKSSISFQAPVDTSTDMIALVVGICGRITPFEIQVFINGKRAFISDAFSRQYLNNFMESDNLWLANIPGIFLPSSREDYIDLEVKVVQLNPALDEIPGLKALGVYLMEG
ncbi:hypothetical protein L6164_017325 [Bauhinia variegata]|uniref:Uncharacterized protein n=1 Tax=Bauhinia variegata TaxID=167791 RepID=A0ACB9N8B0_BAUVA|nr:hypothetical protein L6164_017325 [Bauhinia variegata]